MQQPLLVPFILYQLTQSLAEDFDLTSYRLPTWTSNSIAFLHAGLKIKYTMHILRELVIQTLVVLQCKFIELALARLSECHFPAGNVMCLAERNLTKNMNHK